MEYIAFMHRNTESPAADEEWADFIELAKNSGIFRGGSEIGARFIVGPSAVPDVTVSIDGFMRFESDSRDVLETLLEKHPTVVHGGTVEICEMPLS